MNELLLTAEQTASVTTPVSLADDEALFAMPLIDGKRLAAAAFERRYLVRLMKRVGSISEAARQAGVDRTNFRRLLQRHGLHVKVGA